MVGGILENLQRDIMSRIDKCKQVKQNIKNVNI